MKEKICNALKTKYSNIGFGPKAFDGVADYLSKTVTEDSQLETAISGVELLLKAFQSDIDKVRTEKFTLQTQLDELKKVAPAKGGGQENNEPEKLFNIEGLKAEMLKTFREEIAAAMLQKQQETQQAILLSAKAKEYGIPEKFAAKFNIPQDADLDEYFKGARQDLADAGFEFSEPPTQGGGISDNGSDIAKLINTGTEQIVKSQTK